MHLWDFSRNPGENWIYGKPGTSSDCRSLANELVSSLVILAAQDFLSQKRWSIRPPSQLINTRRIKPSPLVEEGSLGLRTDRMENHWPSAPELLQGVWVTVFPLLSLEQGSAVSLEGLHGALPRNVVFNDSTFIFLKASSAPLKEAGGGSQERRGLVNDSVKQAQCCWEGSRGWMYVSSSVLSQNPLGVHDGVLESRWTG